MKTLHHGRQVLLITGWLATALLARAGDWPGFRGPHCDGVAQTDKTPVNFGPDKNLAWKTETLPGISSPVIWGDRLFLTGTKGNNLVISCFDRSTGKSLWEQSVSVDKLEPVHNMNSDATPTPVTDGKALYVYFGSFGLLAYDFDGKELWRKPLPLPKTFMNQGTGTSPVLADGKLLVFQQLGNDSHLLAVNPGDGKELWKAGMPKFNTSYSTPVVWSENGKAFAGMTCGSRFSAYQLSDGAETWWVNEIGLQACSTPVVAGDKLVICAAGVQGEPSNITPPPSFDEMIKKYDKNGDGLLSVDEIPKDMLYTDRHASQGKGDMALRMALQFFAGIQKDAKMNREDWDTARGALSGFQNSEWNRTTILYVRTGGKKDVTDSQVVWKETKGVPEVPSPLVLDGHIYLIRNGGILVCRDLATGKMIYEERVGSIGGYFASPIVAGGHIYVASDRGAVTAIKPGETFEVLAHNELREPIMASPVAVGDTLYIRSAKQLWAFAEKSN